MLFSSLMVILSVQVLIIFSFLFLLLPWSAAFAQQYKRSFEHFQFLQSYNNHVNQKKAKINKQSYFLNVGYIQRHVSPFSKANSNPVGNIFGFPDVLVFNTSCRLLITICKYSSFILVRVSYLIIISMRCFIC